MSKFAELYQSVREIAKQHTRTVLSRRALLKEEKAILKKWNIAALRMAKIATTVAELKQAKEYAPDGSEAETLIIRKLYKLLRRPYTGGDNWH